MRNLTAAVKAVIAKNLGSEPVNILEIQWGGLDGPWTMYADKDITNYEFDISGQILSISDLESIVKLDNQGQSQGLSVILSDSSGNLKNIFNSNDLHGKRCMFYQWFENLPLSERFKLYEGEIASPIVWQEGDRTLVFEVITKLADKEVGFSPEEGYFEFLPEEAYGKPWPLIFGTVQNVPAVRLSQIPNTQTAEPLGVVDPTLSERWMELLKKYEDMKSLFFFYVFAARSAAFTCSFGDTPDQQAQGCSAQGQYESMSAQIASQMTQIQAEIQENIQLRADQGENQNTSLMVLDGSAFPTGIVTLLSGSIRLQGSFTGNVFTISDMNLTEYTGYIGDPFGFTWQKEGTTITIQSDSPIVYIVNLLPSTVLYVSAYKQVENGQVLVAVPQEWYEVKTEDLGPYEITYITFSKPISSHDDSYADDIYVSVTSPVGPNTVDILEWFITKYTDLAIDSTSFDNVRTKLENYPSHFPLLKRQNILEVVEDIAFQARCAIWISDKTFYIRYLPEEQVEVGTVTEEEIDAGSLAIRASTTEEIVTKFVATWVQDQAISEKNEIILRHNVNKYGTRERTVDFYIYNIFELVMKSATFWIIRKSNVWKHVDFTVYLDKLALETFDVVKFNFAEDFIADAAIKGVLTSAKYNSDSKTIVMSAWLPVKCGSMERYDFAEPHDISVNLLFPTQEELDDGSAGGDGPGTEVEGGFTLSESFKSDIGYFSRSSRRERGERTQGRDHGEERPTDSDDVKPTPNIIARDINYKDEPIYDYWYPEYDIEIAVIEEEKEWSFSFPGKVTGQSSSTLYDVDVYKFGMSSDPENVEVTQLQINTEEIVPVGTWVLVAYNRWQEREGGNYVIKSEYTMQVPVWL